MSRVIASVTRSTMMLDEGVMVPKDFMKRPAAPPGGRAQPSGRGSALPRAATCVGVLRVVEHLFARPVLDDPALFQHCNRRAKVADHRRSCATNKMPVPSCCCMSCNRLITCACTETSSAETGSSQISSLGRITSARAIAMRWTLATEKDRG